jgi:leucyl/phenylalanyl-tRNA--protein transferase
MYRSCDGGGAPPVASGDVGVKRRTVRGVEHDVIEAIERYASGAFPMDDADSQHEPLPWYTAPQRAIFPLDDAFRSTLRRKLRRDLRRCETHRFAVNDNYDEVLTLCATPPPGEGVWITPRLGVLYRTLHAAGFAQSFELRDADGTLTAGILGVVIGGAAMLESMRKTQPSAGNALLSRTLDALAHSGVTLCDIQLPTDHTTRLGCELVDHDAYVAALRTAL